MSRFVPFLFVFFCLAGPALAWQDTPDTPAETPTDKPAEKPADDEEVIYVSREKGFVPGSIVEAERKGIQDVAKHRIHDLDYIRRLSDVLEFDFGDLDTEADVVLTVGDDTITRDDFRRRALIYLVAPELDQHILRLLTAEEIERRDEAGETAVDVKISEEQIDQAVEDWLEVRLMQMNQANPDLTGEELEKVVAEGRAKLLEQIEASMGMDAFRKLMRADAEFEAVFLPMPSKTPEEVAALQAEAQAARDRGEPIPPLAVPTERPAWMPQATWDALNLNQQGQGMLQLVVNTADRGTPLNAMFKTSILGSLKVNLLESAGVQYWFDTDLPDGVFVRVGGKDIKTDELWFLAAPVLNPIDAGYILREELTLRAAKKSLEESGFWLDDEEWATVWHDHEAEFEGTLLPLRTVIMFKGYHSLDRYREHWRYRKSYDKMRRATLSDEEVLDHFQGGGRLFFEKGQMTVAPVFNPVKASTPTEEDYAVAAAELAAAIEAAGDDWSAVQEQFPYVDSEGNSVFGHQRNMLRILMRESELTELITGYGFVMDVFYHGEPGHVYGPYANKCRFHQWGQGPGVWAIKVISYDRAGQLPPFKDLNSGRNYELAYEDFLNLTFYNWLQQQLESYAAQYVES